MIRSDKYVINSYIKGVDDIPEKYFSQCKGLPDGYRITIAELNLYSWSIESPDEVAAQKHCAFPEHKERATQKSLFYGMFNKMYGELRESTNKAYSSIISYLNITQIDNKMLNDCSDKLREITNELNTWR